MGNNMNTEKLFDKLEKLYLSQQNDNHNKTIHFASGQDIYNFGEVPKGIFYVKEGAVKIIKIGANGREIIVRIANSHDFIGYLSLLKSWSYLTSAISLEESEIYFFPKSIFLKAIKTDSEFAYNVIDLLCERSMDSITGMVDMASKNVEQRLSATLLTLDKAETKKYGRSGIIKFRKKDISSMIGSVPETVSRQLAKLERDGLIKTTDKGIEIINRYLLAQISNLGD